MGSSRTAVARRRAERGFTLVEIIVVMAVLTILAGLILPKLDVFKLKANKASAASNMHGVDRFVESYKVERDLFPNNWDSLLGSAGGGTTLFAALDPQLTGSQIGSPTKLTTTTLATDDETRSLVRVGISTVLDHTAGGFPGDSADTPRNLATGATIATINTADADGAAIIAHLYAGTGGIPPVGTKVAVFGLGPRNQIMGDLLHAAPFYANTDQLTAYNRFLVCFEVSSTGSRAKMLGTLGADGDPITDEIAEFYEN